MPQLPLEFHTGRAAAYDSILAGNTYETFSHLDRPSQRYDLLAELELPRLRLALGTLSVDDALFHLLAAIHSKETQSLDVALGSAERAHAYLEVINDIPRTAEALSIKGLIHVAKGLAHPRGERLVPEFAEATANVVESELKLQSANINMALPANAVINDLEARLNDWRGRRVNDRYFQQKVIELIQLHRQSIPVQEPTNGKTKNVRLAV